MTEKRFQITDEFDDCFFIREKDNEALTTAKDFENKLNELSEQADAVRTELQLCEEENTELQKENEQLKQALLFFVDVSNSECSSNWQKDMENDCQKLFNCSYEEAKEKYGDYDCIWWELGE